MSGDVREQLLELLRDPVVRDVIADLVAEACKGDVSLPSPAAEALRREVAAAGLQAVRLARARGEF